MINSLPDLVFIEPHDEHIAAVTLNADRSVMVQFDRLPIYRQVASDHHEIWHHPATLKLAKARRVELTWRSDSGAYIDDASCRMVRLR